MKRGYIRYQYSYIRSMSGNYYYIIGVYMTTATITTISSVNVMTISYPTTSTTVGMVTTTPLNKNNTATLGGEGIVIASSGVAMTAIVASVDMTTTATKTDIILATTTLNISTIVNTTIVSNKSMITTSSVGVTTTSSEGMTTATPSEGMTAATSSEGMTTCILCCNEHCLKSY